MKRIAICCDGTWDSPQSDTNVFKISNLIKFAEGVQVVHYHSGVGASGNIFQKLAGGITGAGLDDNIMEAYEYIVANYLDNDEIYLFGFSRGAYTARSLAGFIRKCGILKPMYKDKIKEAFALYRKRDEDNGADSDEAVKFRKDYSIEVGIKFIGVWDTVGDLGIPLKWFQFINANKYKFHDVELSSKVKFAYHAIGVDEHREIFDVTPWKRSKNATEETIQTIEQVWFTGAHGNIGGGLNEKNASGGMLSNHTLKWMIEKAKGAGLTFNEIGDLPFDCINDQYTESVKGIWWFLSLGKKFYRKEISNTDFISQSIDPSVIARRIENKGYNPPNIP